MPATKPSDETIETIKRLTAQLAQQAKADPAFAARLKDDPLGALAAAGLPGEASAELAQAWGYEPDVVGYEYTETDYCVYYTSSVETYSDCTYFTS